MDKKSDDNSSDSLFVDELEAPTAAIDYQQDHSEHVKKDDDMDNIRQASSMSLEQNQMEASLTNLFDSTLNKPRENNRFDLTQKINDNFKDILPFNDYGGSDNATMQ